MNNNITKLMVAGLACAAICTTALAAPHGGKSGPAPRPAPNHHAPQAKSSQMPRHVQPVPQAQHTTPGHLTQARHAPSPQVIPPHKAAPMPPKIPHIGRPIAHHTPPPRPKNHRPCGRLHPHGHHIGEHHVAIVPPIIVVDSYYWTEEVLINGVYYILYCYPDGTKRFADGTIFCYF